jgi:hypothetical protein
MKVCVCEALILETDFHYLSLMETMRCEDVLVNVLEAIGELRGFL